VINDVAKAMRQKPQLPMLFYPVSIGGDQEVEQSLRKLVAFNANCMAPRVRDLWY